MNFWKKVQLGFVLALRWENIVRLWKKGGVRERAEEVANSDPVLGPFFGEVEAAIRDTERLF